MKLLKAPSLYTLELLRSNELLDTMRQGEDEKWVPARPIGYFSLANRLKLAWMVFKGEADAFTWPGNQ